MVSCFLILLHTDGNPAYVSSSAVVVVQAMLMVPSFTITTPRTTLRSRTTRIISSSKSKLYSITDEDQDEQNFPPPRRTRRIDEILEGEDPEHYPPEESIEYDDLDRRSMYNDLTMSVLSLESSLEREREKSSTLAIRLAKAERMIEDQQNRFDKEHTALVNKDDALAQTQRKLQDMERKLAQQEYQQQQPKISSTIAPDQQQQQQKQQKQQQQQTPSWQYPKLTSKERQYPMVSYWTLNANTGEIRGVVSCHPSIPDGTTIVTSALTSSSVQKAGASFVSDPLDEQHNNTNHQPATVITTQSGSKYQLGVRKKQQTATAAQYVPRSKDQQQQQQQQQQPGFGRGERQPQQQPNKDEVHPMNKLYPHLKYPLTGQLISNGLGTKYLLAGVPKRKPSGRSTIVKAYLSDDQARPIDTNKVYVIKLSTNTDKLKREYDNYCRIQHGLSNNIIDANTIGSNPGGGDWIGNMVSQLVFDSRSTTQSYEQYQQSVTDEKNPFVKCYDFFPSCQGSIMYAQHSALVMEKGYKDLRDHVLKLQHQEQQKQDSSSISSSSAVSPNKVTMAPYLIQRSLLTAAICLNTLHTKARLVYTDLKAENLVFMDQQNIDSEDGEVVIKGIDLESCIPNGGHPIDYTYVFPSIFFDFSSIMVSVKLFLSLLTLSLFRYISSHFPVVFFCHHSLPIIVFHTVLIYIYIYYIYM